MEHVVFFSESTGEPAFRRFGDLEAAVQLVESLRNDRGITDVTLHALTPVPVSFRAYYRVEVGSTGAEESVPDVMPEHAATSLPLSDSIAIAEAMAEPMPMPEPVSLSEVAAPAPLQLVALQPREPDAADDDGDGEMDAPMDAPVDAWADSGPPTEQADEPDTADESPAYQPLVPLVRQQSEPERSLGYFAR
jgi:hypothetical protein